MITIDLFVKKISKIWGIPKVDLKQEELPGTMLARIDVINSVLEISNKVVLKNTVTCDVAFVLAHELRHLWQYKNGWDLLNHKEIEDKDKYNSQIEEIDANAFAVNICEIVFNKTPVFESLSEAVKEKIYNHADLQDEAEAALFDML